MRANEFVQEAQLITQLPQGYYSVGDSIASKIGVGGNWQTFAQQGAESSSPLHRSALDRIPKGSVVAISVGNDEITKTSEDPAQISAKINSLVQYAKDKGLKPVFVLFPRLAGENQPKGDVLRTNIVNSVNVPMLDMQAGGAIANPAAIGKQIEQAFPISSAGAATAQAGATITAGATSGKVGQVLDLIAKYESRGNYNIILGGSTKPLTSMTIAQVYDLQRQMIKSGKESSAVGRYQYIKKTLQWMVSSMGLDPNTSRFDEKTQDAIAVFDMRKRCGLNEWLSGRISDKVFLSKLSKVWASIPNPATGKSAYSGVGSNVAGTSASSALAILGNISGGKGGATQVARADVTTGQAAKPASKSSPPATGLNFKDGVDPRINPELAAKIQKIFADYGRSLPIHSGYRDPARNRKAGGAKNSAHMRQNAVDIDTSALSRQERLKLIQIASANGIGGIGVYKNNLHFDIEKKRAWGPSFSYASMPDWAKPAINAHLSSQFTTGSQLA